MMQHYLYSMGGLCLFFSIIMASLNISLFFILNIALVYYLQCAQHKYIYIYIYRHICCNCTNLMLNNKTVKTFLCMVRYWIFHILIHLKKNRYVIVGFNWALQSASLIDQWEVRQYRKLKKKIRKIQNVVQFFVSKTAHRTCMQKNSTDEIAYNNHCLMLEFFFKWIEHLFCVI